MAQARYRREISRDQVTGEGDVAHRRPLIQRIVRFAVDGPESRTVIRAAQSEEVAAFLPELGLSKSSTLRFLDRARCVLIAKVDRLGAKGLGREQLKPWHGNIHASWLYSVAADRRQYVAFDALEFQFEVNRPSLLFGCRHAWIAPSHRGYESTGDFLRCQRKA